MEKEINPMKNEKKMNNKGFSLVELIIVIAIMAVLIGVLAPTYLRYVEKSRISADGTMVQEFVDALSVLGSDVDAKLDNTKDYTVSSDSDGTIKISSALLANDVFKSYIDTSKTYTLKSTDYKTNTISYSLVYDSTGKVWTVKDNKAAGTP